MLNVPEEIKELLHQDSCQKNIRIHFPGQERSDICNDMIVMDSVSFTESLCSQNTLKFGLCESPVFECEVVGVGNITGARIIVSCEIYCDQTITGAVWRSDLMAYVYPISYGTFTVQSAKRQADMIHRKIVAYGYMYNSLLFDVNQETALSVFELSEIKGSSSSKDIGLEPILYETYPYLFNEKEYDATDIPITDSMPFGNPIRTWSFWTNGGINKCTLELKKGQGGFGKASNEMVLIDWDYMPIKREKEFDSYKNSIINQLMTAYPDAQTGTHPGDPPFDFRAVINEINYVDYYPSIVYRRHDYISSTSSNPKDFYANSGRWLIFNSGSTQGFELINKGIRFSIMDYGQGSEIDIGDPFCYFASGGHYCRALINDIKKTSYTLTASNDKYTEVGFYGQTVTCSGYSFRKEIEELDIYKLLTAYAEIKGFFWNISRDNPIKIYIKQQFNLLPEDDLYPDSDLYPEGVTGGKLLPADYQTCWYSDEYTKSFGAVQCRYTNTSNEDCIFILYLAGFDAETPTGMYRSYILDNNYIIQNSTWTQEQIESICNVVANAISGVAYMPVEFTGRGLPYVEAGDTFEILTASNDSITTIVLKRTLTGEQVLTDSYKSV